MRRAYGLVVETPVARPAAHGAYGAAARPAGSEDTAGGRATRRSRGEDRRRRHPRGRVAHRVARRTDRRRPRQARRARRGQALGVPDRRRGPAAGGLLRQEPRRGHRLPSGRLVALPG
ncbi:hypothetical protein FLX07_26980 [Microbispora bryophytorum]|nr:hypothetical protein FLX07_26980 [Microbispora bryophytorum]